jgi:hypothetical protein
LIPVHSLFCEIGVWTSDLTLARQALYCWATPPALFALLFWRWGSHFLPRNHTPLLPYPTIGWDGGLINFLLRPASNCDPPDLSLLSSLMHF